MRISDWSSDVCSYDLDGLRISPEIGHHGVGLRLSDLRTERRRRHCRQRRHVRHQAAHTSVGLPDPLALRRITESEAAAVEGEGPAIGGRKVGETLHCRAVEALLDHLVRSEAHTSELQSLMRISYAVFCLKKKNTNKTI